MQAIRWSNSHILYFFQQFHKQTLPVTTTPIEVTFYK